VGEKAEREKLVNPLTRFSAFGFFLFLFFCRRGSFFIALFKQVTSRDVLPAVSPKTDLFGRRACRINGLGGQLEPRREAAARSSCHVWNTASRSLARFAFFFVFRFFNVTQKSHLFFLSLSLSPSRPLSPLSSSRVFRFYVRIPILMLQYFVSSLCSSSKKRFKSKTTKTRPGASSSTSETGATRASSRTDLLLSLPPSTPCCPSGAPPCRARSSPGAPPPRERERKSSKRESSRSKTKKRDRSPLPLSSRLP